MADVRFTNKVGGVYSDEEHDIRANMSRDGSILSVEEDMVLEVKYPYADIVGNVK